MYKLVIDLEMCDFVKKQYVKEVGKFTEIIQIGAVLLDENDKQINQFSTYVKPRYSILRRHISDLTGIEEKHLASAPDIEIAFNNMCDILPDIDNTLLCTWSDTDIRVIETEMRIKSIHNKNISKLCENTFDIQEDFNKRVNIKNRLNLAKALNMVGITFEGREHGALADAINTANLYVEMQNGMNVQSVINNIKELMTEKECSTTLGNMFDFSKFNLPN